MLQCLERIPALLLVLLMPTGTGVFSLQQNNLALASSLVLSLSLPSAVLSAEGRCGRLGQLIFTGRRKGNENENDDEEHTRTHVQLDSRGRAAPRLYR